MPKRYTSEEFITIAKNIHGDRYDYSIVDYCGRHKPVSIICSIHGEYKQKPVYHTLRRAGCPKCADQVCPRDSFEDFLTKAVAAHGCKYTYIETAYVASTIKVPIICPDHGEFYQLPYAHVYGQGCAKCGNIASTNVRRKPLEQLLEQFQTVHGGTYDYSKVEYTHGSQHIEVICEEHGSFFPRAGDHLKGSKCPKCSTNKLHSYAAIEWLEYISKSEAIDIQHAENRGEFRVPGTRFKVDGFCVETNTIYEFHGDYWHGNPSRHDPIALNQMNGKTFGELYQRTLQRENIIKSLGYNLVTIWESEWTEMKKDKQV